VEKIFFHTIIIACAFSCHEAAQPAKESPATTVVKTISDTLQRTAAKEWLVKNIEKYFSNFDKLNGSYASSAPNNTQNLRPMPSM
jgi:phosphate-selective porin